MLNPTQKPQLSAVAERLYKGGHLPDSFTPKVYQDIVENACDDITRVLDEWIIDFALFEMSELSRGDIREVSEILEQIKGDRNLWFMQYKVIFAPRRGDKKVFEQHFFQCLDRIKEVYSDFDYQNLGSGSFSVFFPDEI